MVSRCDRGLLKAEYALFDRSEVLLSATSTGHSVQELGYLTTAAFARARLHQALVTADLAHDVYSAFRTRGFAQRLARSQRVLDVVDQLGPLEAFEGGRYRAGRRRYTGTWFDLDAFAQSCPLPDAAIFLQSLHLLLALEEVDENVPVRLLTADATEEGRSGGRTWHKVSLAEAQNLPQVVRSMPVPTRSVDPSLDEAEFREEILRTLRARTMASTNAQPRLQQLAAAFARTGKTPPLGTTTVRIPGAAMALVEELRRHTELLRSDAHLRDVAQFLTAMAESASPAADLAILAARAWLAAGEPAHARHFARMIVEDPTFPDEPRLLALEILETTPVTSESAAPPPATEIRPDPVIVIEVTEPDRSAPAGASLPPSAPDTERMPHVDIPPEPPPPFRPSRPEIVETLPLPPGFDETLLERGARPRTPEQARVAMTRLARELGRDYRLWYGTTLKTDFIAIDAMQRHLRRRFRDAPSDEAHVHLLEAELTRHGALLSEILARSLGAEWTDLESDKPGHWAMAVPPQVRVWPIGRVYRFFRQGHREADLLAFYADLERGARGPEQ